MDKKSKRCKHKFRKLSPEQAFDVCDYFTEDAVDVQAGKFTIYRMFCKEMNSLILFKVIGRTLRCAAIYNMFDFLL